MINCFLGYDSREVVAWHVLVHSLVRRSSLPVQVTAVGNHVLPKTIWWREPGAYDSTEFSNARFAVPALMGYQGWALFMDADMLCLDDLASLWAQRDDNYAVMVVKHEYRPSEEQKFLGATQTRYPRKNWSSLMLFNCAHPSCRELTPDYINRAPGLDLHGFAWTAPDLIGDIRGAWNVLTTGPNSWQHPQIDRFVDREPSLLHFTRGGPWHGIRDRGAALWDRELEHLLAHGNPKADARVAPVGEGLAVSLTYGTG